MEYWDVWVQWQISVGNKFHRNESKYEIKEWQSVVTLSLQVGRVLKHKNIQFLG